MKICQNPIIDVSLVSSIKHQHSACILTSLHRHYNLIFSEITSLLNKTDLCFNRSPLCQLELQGEVTGKKLMHPKFSSREILVSPVSEERRERWGWKEIRNHLNILHFAIISPAAVLQCTLQPLPWSSAAQSRRMLQWKQWKWPWSGKCYKVEELRCPRFRAAECRPA